MKSDEQCEAEAAALAEADFDARCAADEAEAQQEIEQEQNETINAVVDAVLRFLNDRSGFDTSSLDKETLKDFKAGLRNTISNVLF